jgi:NAD(P)-dependent dehydrogenase (short-subunit alcohol dehydrogenase family)
VVSVVLFESATGLSYPRPSKRADQEIAEIVAFLASDRASFIVGSVVMADGGMSVAIG